MKVILFRYFHKIVEFAEHLAVTYQFTLGLLQLEESAEEKENKGQYSTAPGWYLLWVVWILNLLHLLNNRLFTNIRLKVSRVLPRDFIWKPVNIIILRKWDVMESMGDKTCMAELWCSGQRLAVLFRKILIVNLICQISFRCTDTQWK